MAGNFTASFPWARAASDCARGAGAGPAVCGARGRGPQARSEGEGGPPGARPEGGLALRLLGKSTSFKTGNK